MDTVTELHIESLSLQIETYAAAMLSINAKLDHIAEQAGISLEGVKLSDSDREQNTLLLKSIARRLVKVALLSAAHEGIEVDEEKVAQNTVKMLQEASETKGQSLRSPDAGSNIFEGAFPAENETLVPSYAGDFEEDEENLEPATDEDLLAMFRSTRKKKVEDPYVEIKDGSISANFYNPETAPKDPEEFLDYDNKAALYFKSLTEKLVKNGLMDKATARHVTLCIEGDENFNQEMIFTADGDIASMITEQGHQQPYFNVQVANAVEAAEAIISAYSVSIARLRGAYVQAKLQELQEYAAMVS